MKEKSRRAPWFVCAVLMYLQAKVYAQASVLVTTVAAREQFDKRGCYDYISQNLPLSSRKMSESLSDQDPSVLGKRVHDGSPQKTGDDPESREEEDDDDVGPMPMPVDASSNGAARKKRKGLFAILTSRGVTFNYESVLPHEKLYLEHLPAADRYFKSFMHRDAINFNIVTK